LQVRNDTSPMPMLPAAVPAACDCAATTDGTSLPPHRAIACHGYDENRRQRVCSAEWRSGCAVGFSACAWEGHLRVAWFHVPKTGSGILTSLARTVNQSLPAHARIPEDSTTNQLTWEVFFKRWDPSIWFSRSAPFAWRHGMHHAPLTSAVYSEFEGRLFTMMRVPRARGASAFFYYHGATDESTSFTTYARCLQGSVARQLTGEPEVHESHLLVRNASNGRWRCRRTHRPPPNMTLARHRLAGFAFTGLTERWALSVCLLHVRFGGRCDASELVNSRPSRLGDGIANPLRCGAGRVCDRTEFKRSMEPVTLGAQSRVPDPTVFDDPYDGELYHLAAARFERELIEHNVNAERCAAEVCHGIPPSRFV
jgi:hypothetical protein